MLNYKCQLHSLYNVSLQSLEQALISPADFKHVCMMYDHFVAGYVGCYPGAGAIGDSVYRSDKMTLQTCIEACYGAPSSRYEYKYAALQNDTCHCFENIFTAGNINQVLYIYI